MPVTRDLPPIWHAIICLSLAYSSFMSETIRGAIQSVDRGQMEACRSIGMSYFQSMRRIILPQAVHYMIPPLSNNFFGSIQRNVSCLYGGYYGNDAESENDEFQRSSVYGNLSGGFNHLLGIEYYFFDYPEIH